MGTDGLTLTCPFLYCSSLGQSCVPAGIHSPLSGPLASSLASDGCQMLVRVPIAMAGQLGVAFSPRSWTLDSLFSPGVWCRPGR